MLVYCYSGMTVCDIENWNRRNIVCRKWKCEVDHPSRSPGLNPGKKLKCCSLSYLWSQVQQETSVLAAFLYWDLDEIASFYSIAFRFIVWGHDLRHILGMYLLSLSPWVYFRFLPNQSPTSYFPTLTFTIKGTTASHQSERFASPGIPRPDNQMKIWWEYLLCYLYRWPIPRASVPSGR